MTPKDKAVQLVSLFTKFSLSDDEDGMWESWYLKRKKSAKQCALIAVDEIIEEHNPPWMMSDERRNYWQKVKQEIEAL